jgi:hypothetical protein
MTTGISRAVAGDGRDPIIGLDSLFAERGRCRFQPGYDLSICASRWSGIGGRWVLLGMLSHAFRGQPSVPYHRQVRC